MNAKANRRHRDVQGAAAPRPSMPRRRQHTATSQRHRLPTLRARKPIHAEALAKAARSKTATATAHAHPSTAASPHSPDAPAPS